MKSIYSDSYFKTRSGILPTALLAIIAAAYPAFAATPTLDSEQTAFLALINNYRQQNGAGALQVSIALQNSSQWMSTDLATVNYFSHTDSLGRTPGTRFVAFGYPYYPWGENIAAGYSGAQNTLNQWINACDPDGSGACTYAHRQNMLDPSFKVIGIGRAYSASATYGWYWTTDFGGVVDQVLNPSNPAPAISSFTASPIAINAGQSSVLSWGVSGAVSVSIDNGVGDVSGVTSKTVSPSQTTTYTLTAANTGGTSTARVTVSVNTVFDSQPPTAPVIVSATVASSAEIDLTWSASADNVGVSGYQISRNGAVLKTVAGSVTSYADAAVQTGTVYTYSIKAFDAAGNYSVASNVAQLTTPGTFPASFLTANTLTEPGLRNDLGNFVGMKFTVGTSPLSVSSLGRMCIAGNSGTHTIKLVNFANGIDIVGGSLSLNMAGCTAGQFKYATLPSAITLSANTAYYLASLEVVGGDLWYDYGKVTSTNVAAVNGTIWFNAGWNVFDAPNTSFGPPNFLYAVVSGPPDLTITKTHTGNFASGQTGATYTITASNSGAGSTSGTVTVTDTIPAGLTATAITGTGWTCTQPAGPCTRSDILAGGASYPALTLTVNVAASAPASVTNTATVSGGGESNSGNDMANDLTTINPSGPPDLTITKTHTGNFTQGQTGATYTITVNNSGAGSTSGTVTVTDTIPAGLTATAITGTGWSCTQPAGPCTRSDVLAGGASYPALTLTVNVAASAPASVTNTATVSGGGETNTGNDTATNPTTINPTGGATVSFLTGYALNGPGVRNDLSNFVGMKFTVGSNPLSVSSLGRICIAGNSGTHTIKLVNAANGTDIVGGSLSLSMAGCTAGQFKYATLPSAITLSANTAYYLASLEVAGGDLWYDYGSVSSTNVAAVNSSVWFNAGWNVFDAPNTSFGPPNFLYAVASGPPDLTITKTHTGNFASGQTGATYTITASNGGAGSTSGTVTVTDTIPAGLTATAITGTGWTCTQPAGPCMRSDVLAGGASYPALTLTVNVAASAPASVTNTATVSGGGETNTGNDTATNPTTINPTGGATVSFLTGYALNGPGVRNDLSNFVGMKFTVGSNPLSVSSLGRICIAGNSGTHTIKLVNAANGTDIVGGSLSLSMAGCTAGQFKYATLPSAIMLSANTAYYLASLEVAGGDLWYDYGSVSSTNVAAVNSTIWFNAGWNVFDAPNTSFGPPNFLYQ